MGLVSPTQVSDGSTADASDINTPVNQIAAVINGNIDNSNVAAAAAIDGSKIAANSIDIGAKASTWDGWIAVTDTWSYASATTVTVPSDATTKYSVGDKVKFSNSGSKFYYITAVSSTVLTLNGGSDYTVANAAISAIYYSKAETPTGFPQYFNYTPTFANTTLGSGTSTGRFAMSGKTVFWEGQFTLGAGSAVSTNPTVTTPTTMQAPLNTIENMADGTAYDNAGTLIKLLPTYSSTTTLLLYCAGAGGAYVQQAAITNLVPFTWGSGDALVVRGHYQTA